MSEIKRIAKKHGQTVNKLVREDHAKIRYGKPTGKNLYSFNDKNYSQKDIKKSHERAASGGGKGDAPRNCYSNEYRKNYDEIFGERKINGKGGRTIKKY
jgi:hypothetical protein